MTPEEEAAEALSGFTPIGDHPIINEMSDAIMRDIAARGPVAVDRLDPRILTTIEDAKEDELIALEGTIDQIQVPILSVVVDFNELLEDHGENCYEIIGKLKDLLT